MMRDFWVGCLLVGTLAWTQAKLAPPADAQHQDDTQKPSSAPVVAADAPVLTIKGLCASAETDRPKSPCQTVITRAQFEMLADALHTDPQTRRHFAKAYPQFLVMAHQAEQRGLDKQPRFQAKLNFARLQILSQELMVQIQEEAAKVPQGEIDGEIRGQEAVKKLAFRATMMTNTSYLKWLGLPTSLASTHFLSSPLNHPMLALVAVSALG
jgi:hypothetical protein